MRVQAVRRDDVGVANQYECMNNGGSVEEIVDEKMKKDYLNEIIIPRMANDRLSAYQGATSGGKVDPNEIHKFEWYISFLNFVSSCRNVCRKLLEMLGSPESLYAKAEG